MDKIQQFMWDGALAMLAHMVPPMLERKDLEYAIFRFSMAVWG